MYIHIYLSAENSDGAHGSRNGSQDVHLMNNQGQNHKDGVTDDDDDDDDVELMLSSNNLPDDAKVIVLLRY